jgi:hypothetical protein
MNMKNVNGLMNAMRLVESACEKGEITIIGEGGTPTPVELYKKCVAYINAQYGVDILKLVLKEEKSCECDGSCATTLVVADEDEDEAVIVVDLGRVEEIVEKIICDNMGYLHDNTIEKIVEKIASYYESIDGDLPEYHTTEDATDEVYDILDDYLDLAHYDEDYIDEIVSAIVDKVEDECISVE